MQTYSTAQNRNWISAISAMSVTRLGPNSAVAVTQPSHTFFPYLNICLLPLSRSAEKGIISETPPSSLLMLGRIRTIQQNPRCADVCNHWGGFVDPSSRDNQTAHLAHTRAPADRKRFVNAHAQCLFPARRDTRRRTAYIRIRSISLVDAKRPATVYSADDNPRLYTLDLMSQ